MPKPIPVLSARSFSKQGFKWVLGLLIIALFVSNALYFAVHMKSQGTSTTTLAKLNQAVVEKATASLRLRGKLGKSLHAEQISSSGMRPERTLQSPPPRLLSWDNVVSKLVKKEASRSVEASIAPAVVEAAFICMDKDLIGCGKK